MGYNYTYNNDTNTYSATTYNYVYTLDTDTWASKTPMPINQSEFAIAAYQNQIYVIGGWIKWETPSMVTTYVTGTTQVYDVASDSWETKAAMPCARGNLQANVVEGKIYLTGGRLQNGADSNINQVYDPSTNSWTEMAPLPTPVSDYASVVVDKKIYIIGGGRGGNNGNALNLVQIYDTETNTWTYGAPLPVPAGNAAAATIKEQYSKIYVLGISNEYFDVNSTAMLQIYDLQTNSWTTGVSIPAPGYISFSMVTINETFYAIGGRPFAWWIPGLFSTINTQYFPLSPESTTILPAPTPSPTQSPTATSTPTPSDSSSTSPSASSPTEPATPSPSTTPEEPASNDLYLVVASVIVIVIVVAIAAVFLRKRK